MSAPQQVASPYQRQTLGHRLFLAVTWILKGLLRAGLPMGPMVLLTVRGRKSGVPRTTPVDLFERSGRSFLVSTHRQECSNWVRNLRAAGEGVVSRGRNRRAITVVEMPAETAGAVLKEVLGPRLALPLRGFVLRVVPGVRPAEVAAAGRWLKPPRPYGLMMNRRPLAISEIPRNSPASLIFSIPKLRLQPAHKSCSFLRRMKRLKLIPQTTSRD